MKFYRLWTLCSALLLLTVESGCGGARLIPAFTLNVNDSATEISTPVQYTSTGRVVLAEVFTYDE